MLVSALNRYLNSTISQPIDPSSYNSAISPKPTFRQKIPPLQNKGVVLQNFETILSLKQTIEISPPGEYDIETIKKLLFTEDPDDVQAAQALSLLRSNNFFKQLLHGTESPEEMQAYLTLIKAMKLFSYRAGELISKQGEKSEGVISLIIHGEVCIRSKNQRSESVERENEQRRLEKRKGSSPLREYDELGSARELNDSLRKMDDEFRTMKEQYKEYGVLQGVLKAGDFFGEKGN